MRKVKRRKKIIDDEFEVKRINKIPKELSHYERALMANGYGMKAVGEYRALKKSYIP